MSNLLRTQFYKELKSGKKALNIKQYNLAFYHFENAHILGQKHIYRHTVSHYYMLTHGIKTIDLKEILGQLLRIVASVLFTLIWVPKGNTGGSNISPIKSISIRKELKKYFKN